MLTINTPNPELEAITQRVLDSERRQYDELFPPSKKWKSSDEDTNSEKMEA